jgi:flagellar export protein FliJ
MAFRSALKPVLSVREIIEKREEVALKRAQLEVTRVRRRIEELTDELAKANLERDQALLKSVQANRLQSMQGEINAANETKQLLNDTLKTLKSQRDTQMKVYTTAHSGRRMLSEFLAQQKNQYEQEQTKVQQKRLDDIVATRWQRN